MPGGGDAGRHRSAEVAWMRFGPYRTWFSWATKAAAVAIMAAEKIASRACWPKVASAQATHSASRLYMDEQ